ncbi:MAG: hypothetical protein DRI69_09095 [Bacteroidetes bacterium]|nr:MAG: hypothetical protein DRI69_09095 [Bacteroidota bacterium]
MNPIKLKWSSPTSWKDTHQGLNKESKKIRGIYLLLFKLDGKFIPYYIGQAGNIHPRIAEHIASMLCGKYTIYRNDILKKFAHDSVQKKEGKDYDGILYHPDWPWSLTKFLKNQKDEEIMQHVNFMIKSLYFSCAEVKDDMPKLQQIEGACILEIGKEHLGNMRASHPDFEIEHGGDDSEIKEIFRKYAALRKSKS